MNIEAGEAIQAVALQFSDCLKKGAALIITIKCITQVISKIIKKSEELLGKEYEIVGVRAGPKQQTGDHPLCPKEVTRKKHQTVIKHNTL